MLHIPFNPDKRHKAGLEQPHRDDKSGSRRKLRRGVAAWDFGIGRDGADGTSPSLRLCEKVVRILLLAFVVFFCAFLLSTQSFGAAAATLTNAVYAVDTLQQLTALSAASIPNCTSTSCVTTIHVKDPIRGGLFYATNTIVGTNMGTLLASSGMPGWSWQREYSGPTMVTWFGTQGAPADDTVPISNAITAVEYGLPGGVLYFPEGTYRAQGLHVHRCYLKGAGMTLGPWQAATLIELVPNATADLIYLDESSAADNQIGSGISDMTLNGHRSANLLNPVAIASSLSRTNFTVSPTTIPSTLLDDGTWMHYGFCFFYTAGNRYAGYGLVQSVNPITGGIQLAAGYDRYAAVSPNGLLPAGWKVCFTPYRSTTLPPRFGGGTAKSFNDPVAAGRSGLVISSANVTIENLCVWDFHCGIAGYTTAGSSFMNVWCDNNAFCGIANADLWSADCKFERLFVQGIYYEYPGEAPESPPLADATWRHTAYGVYGFFRESVYDDISVAACVVDVGDTGGDGTDVHYLLLDVPIKSGISSLGSLSQNQSLRIGTLDARSWGSFGTTNGTRQLPANQGTYAVWDQVAGGRYYSIDKFSVNSFEYAPTNWFTTVFNYWAAASNSPVTIKELVEFTGAQTWFTGGGAPPTVLWIDPKAAITSTAPDGWHQSSLGVGYSIAGNDAMTFRADGSVTVNNLSLATFAVTNLNTANGTISTLNAGNLSATSASMGSLSLNTLAFTNLVGGSGFLANGSIGNLVSTNLSATNLASGTGMISNLITTTLTSGAAAIGTLNTTTFNSPTGVISGFTSYNLNAGNSTLTNVTIQNAVIQNGTVGKLLVTNLITPTAAITALGANTLNAPTGTITSLTSQTLVAGSAAITNANIALATIANGTAGNLTINNLLAPAASITTLGASTINAPTGTITSFNASSISAGSASFGSVYSPLLTVSTGAFGTLSTTNLNAQNGSIANLGSTVFNSPTGTISSLNSLSIVAGSALITNANLSLATIGNGTAGNLTINNLLAPAASITTLGASTINSPTGYITGFKTLNLDAGAATAASFQVTNLTAFKAVLTSANLGSLYSPLGSIDQLNSLNFVSPAAGIASLNVGTLTLTNSLSAAGTVTSPQLVATASTLPSVVTGPGGLQLTGAPGTYNTTLFSSAGGGFQTWNPATGIRLLNLTADTNNTQLVLGGSNSRPRNLAISGDLGLGTNVAGADVILQAMAGTGNNAGGGNFHFYTPDVTASGSTVQSFTEKFTILRDGSSWFRPATNVPTAGAGKVYSDGGQLYFSDTNLMWFALTRTRAGSGLLNLNFNTIAAGDEVAATAIVNFAMLGENVVANPRNALPKGVVLAYSRVSAANTVEVAVYNLTANPITLGTVAFDIKVVK